MDDRSDVPAMMRRELDSWLQYGGTEPDRGKVMPRTSAPAPQPVMVAPGTRPMVRPGLGVTPRAAPSGGPAPAFTPAPPRFTPGSLARGPSQAPASPPPTGTPTQATGLSPWLIVPAGAAATGIYQTGQALRERGQAPNEPRTYQDVSDMTAVPEPSRVPIDEVESQYLIRGRNVPIDEVESQYIVNRAKGIRQPDPSMLVGSSGVSATPSEPSGDGGSFLSKIFSGKDYQSSGGQLWKGRDGERYLNWGDPESAADFARASAAMARMSPSEQASLKGVSGRDIDYDTRMSAGKSEGGGVTNMNGGKGPTKEAMLHKALEIIHHLIQK